MMEMELRYANEDQDDEVTEITYLSWGAPHVTRDQYKEREDLFRSTNFGQWMIDYVFVPKNDRDTIDVRGYLELFKRTCVIFPHDESTILTLDCYSVASVFTPEKHRKKGYASAMLQAFVASQSFQPYIVSNLYSDIGAKFYTENGWKLFSSEEIIFPVNQDEEFNVIESSQLYTIDSRAELDEVCELDRKNMMGALKPGQVGILMTSDCIEFYHVKHKYCGKHNHKLEVLSTKYGAYTRNQSGITDYVLWTYNFESTTLDVLKYHAQLDVLPELIQLMKAEAKEWGLISIRLWPTKEMQLPVNVLDLAQPRSTGLSMLLVKSNNDTNEAFEWISNEKYLYA
ncbi:hypothetical protein THRCLA_20323 [Thraustotheca clavata]|uniref:LYC1 C-terminal domain-containing protein n=1 Tax=Thraustotheca clavata TaxID=74557 RepID=A0A1W0A8U1_9STRA|nr:hypothetical protein THRCLA_20323 [Thraustotheca clavata]